MYSPGFEIEPENCPVVASTATPFGRLSAEKLMGLVPVAGMVNNMGWPGRTPNTWGPLIFGCGLSLGVKIYFESVSCALAANIKTQFKRKLLTKINAECF